MFSDMAIGVYKYRSLLGMGYISPFYIINTLIMMYFINMAPEETQMPGKVPLFSLALDSLSIKI